MNKRLIAVAVAGALAAPVAAFAQSSVTISGLLKGGYENYKLGNYQGAAGTRGSGSGVVDDSSRIVFNVVEDLGGGLQAIGQVDVRYVTDTGAAAGAAGNTHFGLRSKQWGRIFFGRQDLHYFNRESDLTGKGSLRADSISLLAYAGAYNAAGAAVNGGTAIAGATRTPNVIHYTTPNWGGFTAIVAYSSNQNAADGDVASATRKGSAWNINPNFAGSNWQIGYSYWRSKPDGAGAAALAFPATNMDQRGDRLYGSYKWGGLKVGLAWDKSKLKTHSQAAGNVDVSNRTVWSLPVSYTWGNHSINAHYDRASRDKAAAAAGLDTKARMFAISYAYDLSKRTSAALTYATIRNGANAGYGFFTGGALGVSGLVNAGEDPKLWGVTLRHAF